MNEDRIRFRAWDWKAKVMRHEDCFHVRNGKAVTYNEWGGPIVTSWELMQYASRKDMFGKVIYRGDIVKFYLESYGRTYTGPAIVEYHDCNFCLRVPNNHKYNIWLGSRDLKDIENIGNIYENPEVMYERG